MKSTNEIIIEIATRNLEKARKEGKTIKCTVAGYEYIRRYRDFIIYACFFGVTIRLNIGDLGVEIQNCERGTYKYKYNVEQIMNQLMDQQFEFEIYAFDLEEEIVNIRIRNVKRLVYSAADTSLNGIFSGEVFHDSYVRYNYSSNKNSIGGSSAKRFIGNPHKLLEEDRIFDDK